MQIAIGEENPAESLWRQKMVPSEEHPSPSKVCHLGYTSADINDILSYILTFLIFASFM